MFPSTQLVFTKSFRLNFSTSGSSGNSGIDDGGESGRDNNNNRLLQLLQHPSQRPSEGLKQVLFRLNFYLRGGGGGGDELI